VRRRRSALAPHAPVPHPLATAYSSALALGCACQPGSCTRASARGGRHVVPVAGHDAAAAGVSRRDGSSTCTHVLPKPRVEARITLTSCAPSPNARPSTERRHGQNDATRVRPPGPTARRDAGTRSLLPTCTRGMARRPARTNSRPHEHGAKAGPLPCLARRRQRPRAQAAQGLPPSRCDSPTAPQARPRRGKEKGAVVLTRGRRWSRGRPAGDVALVFR
jgi:hypothetical protein